MMLKHKPFKQLIEFANIHKTRGEISVKKINKVLSIFVAIAIIFTCIPFGIIAGAASIENDMTIVDNSTHHHWHEDIEHSTKEVGRIWTDKTVWKDSVVYPYEHQFPGQLGVEKGNSDLLVELSALSSAATVTGKTTTTLPLEIVIVMDTSGSMAYGIGTGEYNTVNGGAAGTRISYRDLFDAVDDDELFFKIGNDYVPISASRSGGIGNRKYTISYTLPGATAPTYIVNNQSNAYFNLPYAVCEKTQIQRIEALQDAVNAFITSTQEKNRTIENQEDRHRIALVEFYTYSRQIVGLTYVDSQTNVNTLTRAVNGLETGGSTRADSGLETAQSILDGQNNRTRDGAQKVIIFFTDGEPTSGNNFENAVANAAIATAKELKDKDALIYSVGVFEGADPSDLTRNFNQYMHGVSSNYPNATAYTTLGDSDSTNYYLSATDAAGLSSVFSGILEDVTSLRATASTQVEEGSEGTSGYITFVDPLGKYMEVDDFKAISFAERNYEDPEVTTNGNITTYTFEGENQGNALYPTTGNLNQIIITVEKSDDLAVGDIVTVKIPGALIPIHYYQVDIAEDGKITMTKDHTLPIRVWYGVSVKEDAQKALENPDAQLKAYIEANKDENGLVQFYSNLYEQGNQAVYSSFEPNQRNNFYFYQNDEFLFTDYACTIPATSINENTTYYYQRDYYNPKANPSFEGEAEKLVNTIAVPGSAGVIAAGYAKVAENGQYYVPKGTPRRTSITNYAVAKTPNETNTSANAILPSWVAATNNPTTVKNELGNNGIIKLAVPGTLAVEKIVTADEGLTAPDEEFKIKIELTAPQGENLKDSYTAQIVAKNGTTVGNAFDFEPGDPVTLKADQTVYIYGLAAGTTYTVTEPANDNEYVIPDGFAKVGAASDTGAIASGQTSEVTVTNKYSVQSSTLTASDLGLIGTKILAVNEGENREFKSGEEYQFIISATLYSTDAPLPSKATKVSDSVGIITIAPTSGNEETFDIGDFKFEKPGEYHYEIREKIPDTDKVIGVSYDSTIYRVIITIVDDGLGGLKLGYLEIDMDKDSTSNWTSLYSGTTLPAANSRYINFTNTYSSKNETIILRGTKELLNKKLTDYKDSPFEFKIEAKTDGAPMPSSTIVSATSTGDIIFPGIVFNSNHVGNEYKYIISEVIPEEAKNNKHLGITYDTDLEEITITVTSKNVDSVETVVPEVTGNQFKFTNVYNAEDVDYDLYAEKNLVGRDFLDGDAFKFEVEPIGDAPQVMNGTTTVSELTIEPAADNQYAELLGKINFTVADMLDAGPDAADPDSSARVKSFAYRLREVDLQADGITYDTTEKLLTIVVKDLDGELSIVSATVDGAAITDGKVAWTNTYTASTTYGGINIIKTLIGKEIVTGEFSFKLTAEAGTPELSATDKQFSTPIDAYYNPATNSSSVVMSKLVGLTFNQDDAGKTFSYILQEVIPQDTGRVTYDESQYKVELKPYDNGDGTMDVKTVITKIKDQLGAAANEVTQYDSKGATDLPAATFTNNYEVVPGVLSGQDNLSVKKIFLGRDWTADDEFSFELKLKEGDVSAVTMPSETVITIDNQTERFTKAFGDISFNKEGTYTFTVNEILPTGGKLNGVTYDGNVSDIVVEVVNNGSGYYVVDVTEADTLTFVNTYAVESGTTVYISGEKEFKGGVLNDDDFTFELYSANENFEISDNSEPETKTNQNREFNFTLTYEPTDVGKTFYYVLREKNFGEIIKGIEYDSTQYYITVTVEDDGVGGAKATKTINNGTDDVTDIKFVNEYKVRTGDSIELNGTKELTGRDINDGEFTFELYSADSEFRIKDITASATNVSNQFTIEVEYKPEDANKTLYYVLREKNAGTVVDGVDYDSNEYHITVTLTDNGDGTMTATKTVTLGDKDADSINFNNQYSTENATLIIPITKKLEGRELKADEFTFKLYKADNKYAYSEDTLLQAIKNTADGKFKFNELSFDKAGIYYYVVVEDNSVAIEDITFDNSVYLITLEVKDNGKGNLVAEKPVIVKKGVQGNLEEISFKNVYTHSIPDSDTNIPQTSDNRNLALWIAFLFVSSLGFVTVNLKTKKSRQDDK